MKIENLIEALFLIIMAVLLLGMVNYSNFAVCLIIYIACLIISITSRYKISN